jgi:hypothetical protein
MNITKSANRIETKYEGTQTWASATVASHGNCDHNFEETVEMGKCITYQYSLLSARKQFFCKLWSCVHNDY